MTPVAEADDAIELEIAGHPVRITSPGKVLFSERGETKLDLVNYYLAVAEPIMRTIGGRPVLMQRYPHGAERHRRSSRSGCPTTRPTGSTTTIVSTPNGTTSHALVAADLAHIAWAVNLGCLGFHVWPAHADDPEHADELRIDLDPQPGDRLRRSARAAAHDVRTLLDELGHRRVPEDHRQARHPRVRAAATAVGCDTKCASAAVAVARELARRQPDDITDAWWKEERGERIFIDFNQNAPHKTVFGAWCVRATTGAQVSMPFRGTSSTRSIPTRRRSRPFPHASPSTAIRGPAMADEPAVARAAAGDARARPRRRPAGRALAARLPEDAGRAAAGRAQSRRKKAT